MNRQKEALHLYAWYNCKTVAYYNFYLGYGRGFQNIKDALFDR